MTRNVLTAGQAALRLGVKVQTVYAYVSRGLLGRTLAEDGRTSRFDAAEVEGLARRGRPRRESERQGVVDVSLATAVTGATPERLLYRGRDVAALVGTASFERVAELLWTGALPARTAWEPGPEELRVAAAAARALPRSAGALERFAVVTAALAAARPLRVDLRPEAVVDHARALLSAYAVALPNVSRGRPPARAGGFAARLLPRLSPLAPTPARVSLLDATLIVLADHELATSTLAARVAASTRADPFGVVLAGLGAVSGPLHGKAANAAHRMLLDAVTVGAEPAVARSLGALGLVPGFGHPVYSGVDPRAACLLPRVEAALGHDARAVVSGVIAAGERASGARANVDAALAAVAFALDMQPGATEAVFAAARTAGWIAHALEEYGERPLRFRARSLYTGPTPERHAPRSVAEERAPRRARR